MPRGLFLTGAGASALVGVLSIVYAFAAFMPSDGREAIALSGNPAAAVFLLAVLACVFPVAAVFARIASLLAVRNVYQALFATVALACTLLTVSFLAIASLRLAIRVRAPLGSADAAPAAAQLVEEVLVSYYALGLFLSVLLLAIRPWFSIQASGILSGLMLLPSILFGWVVVEEHLLAPVTTLGDAYRSAPSFAFFLIVAAAFIGIAAHCLAHQHYFLEVTNLREIFDGPRSSRGGRMSLGGGVAAG